MINEIDALMIFDFIRRLWTRQNNESQKSIIMTIITILIIPKALRRQASPQMFVNFV